MAVQDSSTLGELARLELAQDESAPVSAATKPARRLPVQKDWPAWALITYAVPLIPNGGGWVRYISQGG